jgi:hypothetical protein
MGKKSGQAERTYFVMVSPSRWSISGISSTYQPGRLGYSRVGKRARENGERRGGGGTASTVAHIFKNRDRVWSVRHVRSWCVGEVRMVKARIFQIQRFVTWKFPWVAKTSLPSEILSDCVQDCREGLPRSGRGRRGLRDGRCAARVGRRVRDSANQ